MTQTRARIATLSLALLVLQLTLPSRAGAQGPRRAPRIMSFAKPGGYVGVSWLQGVTITGQKFDGTFVLIDDEEVVLIPKLDKQNDVALVFGYRAPAAAFEVSYDSTRHGASFSGATGVATYRSINMDAKLFFAARSRIEPFIVLGFAIPWIVLEDGSATPTKTGNATFRGPGFNTGAGVAVYVHPRVGIGVGYRYRFVFITSVTGATEENKKLEKTLRARTGTFFVMTTFTF